MTVAGALALVGCAGSASNSANTGPTPTPVLEKVPTATPIATPSDPTGQKLLQAARGAVGSAASLVEATYDVRAQSLTVTVTISGDLPLTETQVDAAHARTKALCFQELSGLWASGLSLRQTTVVIVGPTKDEYNAIINQLYGYAVVNESTARSVSWASATPESAWSAYDKTYLRPEFDLFDEIPYAPPAATATPK
ncbi:MAG TPA: hypothetical protein VFQ25_02660 [Ktedonobacterales bacterium]|nr:hypothetical protein [Ktedonobacterales bacterium]